MKNIKKTGFIIIARLKVHKITQQDFKKVCGKSFIDHMIIRLKSAIFLENVILCTSNLATDEKLEKISKKII